MKIIKARKKPIVVEAIQLKESNLISVFDFFGESKNYPECKIGGINPETGKFMIKTLEGDMVANIGDWIIKGVNDEFYPCKPDIFKKIYDIIGD